MGSGQRAACAGGMLEAMRFRILPMHALARPTPLESAILVLIALVTLGTARGDVLRVPAQYARIHAALQAAQPGDTVLVAPGTYTENIIWPQRNGLVLLGEGGAAATVIDGSAMAAVVSIESALVDSSTVLRGFTLRNGLTQGT